jgi:PPOX class probable F420-dependent enzyme
MTALTDAAERLLTSSTTLVYLATVNADGSPHVAPLWSDVRDGMIVLNTADGRRKVRNVRRDPRVMLAAHDPDRPFPPLFVEGTVVDITTDGALEHADALSRRYDGTPWEEVPGEVRVLLVIRPDRVSYPSG